MGGSTQGRRKARCRCTDATCREPRSGQVREGRTEIAHVVGCRRPRCVDTRGERWALRLRIVAGPDDGPGEESFDLIVCSLAWVEDQVRRDGLLDGRHHLIVEFYDWQVLREFIERRVRRFEGSSWPDVAERLARLRHWEFEGLPAGVRGLCFVDVVIVVFKVNWATSCRAEDDGAGERFIVSYKRVHL